MAPNYQRFMPNTRPLQRVINRFTDLSLPSSQLRRIGSRAESEALTNARLQQTQLQNIRDQLRQTRQTVLNQLESQREPIRQNFQQQFNQMIAQANQQAAQRGAVVDSGLRIQQMLAGGNVANTQAGQNLGELASQQTQVEQDYISDLLQNVYQPQFELATQQGLDAMQRYQQYYNQAQVELMQGRIQEAEALLDQAQREYNAAVIAAENELLQEQQAQQAKINTAQIDALLGLSGSSSSGSSRGFRKTYGRATPPASFRNHLQAAINSGRVPASWAEPLTELIYRESSWRPTAKNPNSTAYGYGQFLKSTRANYERKMGMSYSNPVNQIIMTAQYIKDRYGDPWKALAFHDRNHWY